jgi:hypothetical protein
MSKRGSLNGRVPVMVALVALLTVGLFGVTAPEVRAAPGDVGQAGPSFAGSGADPTSSKPESKVWFNDGFWWASMYRSTASAFTIHRLSGTTWVDTGVLIDDRETSHQDVLWDQTAGKLYVGSHIFSTSPASGNPARLYRYNYNAGSDTYSLDGGFPQTINDWRTETLVIDKDSTGQLWATWTRGNAVWVNRTTNGDQNWGAEFQPAGTTGSMTSDDISTIVAFGGNKIGLMWSRQNGSPDSFGFAIHQDSDSDTTWGATTAVYAGNNFADDHINLKADPAGNLFAVVKTSLTSGPNVVVLRRSTGGTWTDATFSTGQGTMTRGVLAIDTTNNLLHVFATAPEADGTIYEKTSPLSSLSFAGGLGTQFIRDDSANDLNNPTTTKQAVNSTSGVLVVAGHETLNEYWWNLDPLGGGPPTETVTLTPAADAQVRSTQATTNFGSLNTIRTREQAGGETYRSYLTFNVSGITGTVTSVKLRLFATDPTPNVQSVFSGDPTSWTEGGLNWNNRPTFTTLRGLGPTNAAGFNEITLDPALITGNVPISLLVQSSNTNSGIYSSKEAAASNRPQLVITQTAGPPPDAPPTASPVSKSTPHDVATTINLAGTDAETCQLVFVAPATGPTNGTLGSITDAGCVAGSPNSDSASVVYTPTPGYHGPDSFTYTVDDGSNPPVSATVTLTVTNAAPTATGSTETTPEDTLKTVTLNGGDADDCELTFATATGPTHGTLGSIAPLTCAGTGPFTDSATIDYTPTTGYNGPDSFTFTVFDGVTTSAPATVSITVGTPPNAPPTASPVSKSTPHDVATTINMAGTDAETCQLTFAIGTSPANGSLGSITDAACVAGAPNSDSATVVYTPNAAYHGGDSFTYTVSDGTNPPVSATVTLTVTNAGPTANGSSQTTTQGNPVTFNLVGTDVDDCNLTFNAPSTTSKGTLSATGALACTPGSPNSDRASITYTPNAGQTGADSFTFTVGDGVTTSAAATVNITINSGAPTTVTFVPVADAHVSSSNVGGNYGTITTVKVREGDGSTANPNYRGYFKFNVSGISGTVSSVKLRLFVTDTTTDLQTVLVVTDNSWTETGITYTNAPVLTGLTVAGSSTAPTAGYVEITLTPTTVSSSTTTLSLAIRSAGTNSGVFSSREDATNKPQLQVTFQ